MNSSFVSIRANDDRPQELRLYRLNDHDEYYSMDCQLGDIHIRETELKYAYPEMQLMMRIQTSDSEKTLHLIFERLGTFFLRKSSTSYFELVQNTGDAWRVLENLIYMTYGTSALIKV